MSHFKQSSLNSVHSITVDRRTQTLCYMTITMTPESATVKCYVIPWMTIVWIRVINSWLRDQEMCTPETYMSSAKPGMRPTVMLKVSAMSWHLGDISWKYWISRCLPRARIRRDARTRTTFCFSILPATEGMYVPYMFFMRCGFLYLRLYGEWKVGNDIKIDIVEKSTLSLFGLRRKLECRFSVEIIVWLNFLQILFVLNDFKRNEKWKI